MLFSANCGYFSNINDRDHQTMETLIGKLLYVVSRIYKKANSEFPINSLIRHKGTSLMYFISKYLLLVTEIDVV